MRGKKLAIVLGLLGAYALGILIPFSWDLFLDNSHQFSSAHEFKRYLIELVWMAGIVLVVIYFPKGGAT